MKSAVSRFCGVTLMAAVLMWAFGCSPLDHTRNAGTTELRIGAAETDITPPVGYRMAGYFDERLAMGIHDPLKAKAVVIADGREKLVLVFCDLLGVSLNVTKTRGPRPVGNWAFRART